MLASTQSLELLQEVLGQGDIEGMLDDISLVRLRVKRKPLGETMVSEIGYEVLSGNEAYSLVEQEELDVRLYHALA